MEALAKILYLVGVVPTVAGIIILVILSPRPRTIEDHLQGLARYLMLGGAVFGAARVLTNDASPKWNAVVFMLGIGLAMAIYARRNHLAALAEEASDTGEQSGV